MFSLVGCVLSCLSDQCDASVFPVVCVYVCVGVCVSVVVSDECLVLVSGVCE